MPKVRHSREEDRDPRLVAVGDRIRRARLALSMDQKDLAEIVQVTEKTVSNWEIGEHSPHRKVGHLAEALGVSEAYLWQGEGDAPDSDSIVKVLEDQLRVHRSILDELRLIRLEREDRRQDRVPM